MENLKDGYLTHNHLKLILIDEIERKHKNANKNKILITTEATKLNYLLHPRHSINIR